MRRITEYLAARAWRIMESRSPDFVIGSDDSPYLLRWYITPWRRLRDIPLKQRTWWQRIAAPLSKALPSIYLHLFQRSDDDRALHDHPWMFNASWLIDGRYTEHTIARGGIHQRRPLVAGAFKFRLGGAPHRVELTHGQCVTLFFTGPVFREWGFHCPERGWVHWREFTAADNPGAIGRGCGEQDAVVEGSNG